MAGDYNLGLAEGARQRLRGRGLLRTLFMPEIKLSFGTVGMTHKAFITMIATMFIQSGLLPYNHRAHSMDTIGNYSLRNLMGDAWYNLRTAKKADYGSYALFFAVFLLFSLALLMIITFISQFVISSAAAAGPSIGGLFSPPGSPEDDIGLQLIEHLIGLASRGEGGAQGIALGKLLQIYSYGVLVIASFIIAWSVLSIVVDTAHTGKFFGGRHNPVWWPIRLVFALGLLIPLGHGFSAGQYMVIQIAKWGSNFASHGWAVYVEALLSEGLSEYMANKFPSGQIGEDSYKLTKMALCKHASNKDLEARRKNSSHHDWIHDHPVLERDGGDKLIYKVGKKTHWRNLWMGQSVCGRITIKKAKFADNEGWGNDGDWSFANLTNAIVADSGLDDSFHTIIKGTYENVYIAADDIAEQFAEAYATNGDNFDSSSLNVNFSPMVGAYMAFETSMQNAIRAAIQQNEGYVQNVIDEVKTFGWPTASLWYYMISSANAKIEEATKTMPKVKVGLYKGEERRARRSRRGRQVDQEAVRGEQQRIYVMFNDWWKGQVEQFIDDVPVDVETPPSRQQYYRSLVASTAASEDNEDSASIKDSKIFNKDSVATAMVFFRGSIRNLSLDGSGTHPIVAMAEIGRKMIGFATMVVVISMAGAAATSLLASGHQLNPIAITALGWTMLAGKAAGFLFMIVSPLMIGGVILSIILPMTPFIRFVFAISGWLIAILEGIVAVPIIALGHLRTDGEGIMGPMLQGAYVMMLQLLLRPMLILLGLIMSMSLVSVTVGFVNEMFMSMLDTLPIGGGVNPINHAIRFVGFGVMYGVLMYGLINSSFKIVDLFPEAVTKYLGTGVSGGVTDQENGDLSRAVLASAVFAEKMQVPQASAEDEKKAKDRLKNGTASKED